VERTWFVADFDFVLKGGKTFKLYIFKNKQMRYGVWAGLTLVVGIAAILIAIFVTDRSHPFRQATSENGRHNPTQSDGTQGGLTQSDDTQGGRAQGDSISLVAAKNGRHVIALQDPTQLDPKLLYLKFDFQEKTISYTGRVDEYGAGTRLGQYIDWLNTHLPPLWSDHGTLSTLYIPIDLNDGTRLSGVASMTYFGDDPTAQICMIPDPWAIERVYFEKGENDNLAWSDKTDRVIFAGSDSGWNGHRPRYCRRFQDHRDVAEIYISRWSQGNVVEPAMSHKNMTIEDQLKYKFILSLDGHAASWGRISWGFASKSLVLKAASNLKLWYYELMQDGIHYVEVTETNLLECVKDLLSRPRDCQAMVRNANTFYHDYLSEEAHIYYWQSLLETWKTCLHE